MGKLKLLTPHEFIKLLSVFKTTFWSLWMGNVGGEEYSTIIVDCCVVRVLTCMYSIESSTFTALTNSTVLVYKSVWCWQNIHQNFDWSITILQHCTFISLYLHKLTISLFWDKNLHVAYYPYFYYAIYTRKTITLICQINNLSL
jgi:hypothetical protein